MKLKRKIFYKYKMEKTLNEKILLFIYSIFLYVESLFFGYIMCFTFCELIYFYHIILKMYI